LAKGYGLFPANRFDAALLVSACAPQIWAKPGGTPAEFEYVKAGCSAQSYNMFPPVYQEVRVQPGYYTPMQTSCYGSGVANNCFTSGGYYVPPTFVPVDQNQGARSSAARSCLMMAGWQPVKDEAEAALVTNSVPPPPPRPESLR
jgi:hypothetical protein